MCMFNKLIRIITAPIRRFWAKVMQYKNEGKYWAIVGAFLLSLGLIALMAFVAIYIILWLLEYFSNHIGLVIAIGCIAWLYWAVLHKETVIYQQNYPAISTTTPSPTQADALMIESAEAECDEMLIAAHMILQDVSPHINAKAPVYLSDIIPIVGGKYTIREGFVVNRYYLEKNDIQKRLTDEEKRATIALIQQSYNSHIKHGKITGLTLKPYKDDNLALPPIKVHNLDDWGNGYLIEVVHTDTAYANYYYKAWQAQHCSAPKNYDVDDINLL